MNAPVNAPNPAPTPAPKLAPAVANASAATPARTPLQKAMQERLQKGVKAIKAAQRQMGLDDGAYRALLQAQTRTPTSEGKRSATELTLPEQTKVLEYMRSHGAPHPRLGDGKRRPAPSQDKAALMARVAALLGELRRITGEVHTLAYCDAICKRNGWCDSVSFATPADLVKLVGALSRTVRTKASKTGQHTPF